MLTIFEQQQNDLNSLICSLDKYISSAYYVPDTRRREMQSQRKKEILSHENNTLFRKWHPEYNKMIS